MHCVALLLCVIKKNIEEKRNIRIKMKSKLKAIYKTVSSIIVITFASVFFVITYYLAKLWNLIKKLWKKKEK